MSFKPPTLLGLAILGLLNQQPRSGYDLRKVFASSPMAHYGNSPGAIYPALQRLEERGLVSGRVDRTRSMRPRRIFQTTKEGDTTLQEWTSRPATRDDVAWRMHELVLRFAFMELAGAAATIRFLSSLADEIEGHVDHLQAVLSAMQDPSMHHGRLAMQFGIDTYRAQAVWARQALTSLEKRTPPMTGEEYA